MGLCNQHNETLQLTITRLAISRLVFPGLAIATAVLQFGCAASSDELVSRLDASDADLRDHVTALERSLDAAYDREKALAERLRRMEENVAVLQARTVATGERIDSLGRLPSGNGGSIPTTDGFDVVTAYSAAYEQHQNQDYAGALLAFAQILEHAPAHSLADNAQYWIGESQYGLGRYREALAAFSQVLSFETTEKDDDAQLMIARSYLALGEKDQAVSAFRRMLSEHPDSEYTETARKELRYLGGP